VEVVGTSGEVEEVPEDDITIFAAPPVFPNITVDPLDPEDPLTPVGTCTPRDTVQNPSFEWLEYPLLHWNISSPEDIYIFEGAGYGIDGGGFQSSDFFNFGDEVGWAAAGIEWFPTTPSQFTGATFTLSQLVEVCPLSNYEFTVYFQAFDFSSPSPDSTIVLNLGNTTRTFTWDENTVIPGQWQQFASAPFRSLAGEHFVELSITLTAAPSAFGSITNTGDGVTVGTNVEVYLDVINLVPLPAGALPVITDGTVNNTVVP